MLKGRLGLDSAKVPHKERAGLLYLARRGIDRTGRYAGFPTGGADSGRRAYTWRLRNSASGRLDDHDWPRFHRQS